ncbi:TonB-dependent receptor [Novosphingobium sp. KACC 22771]|uniref:TonB-dependent receptor n=1 Tax=Novosphingobium sp. KACC 22771 TaxID=3025670 RepID=UPI002365D195|nr:TonB-dependent receptor [Novosphingobium sp. KACC 22771]WDF74428.1 TonB-dependent receptor [Novosphingobium sp. KACC 22771]
MTRAFQLVRLCRRADFQALQVLPQRSLDPTQNKTFTTGSHKKVSSDLMGTTICRRSKAAPATIAQSGATSLLSALLAGAALTLTSGTADAQNVDRQGPSNTILSQTSDIVVSARRKDEKLTDVPASITALSSDFIKTQNIQNFTDYATRVPNLSFQYGQGGTLLWAGDRATTIRGVVGNGTTSYYINDTPVPSSVSPLTLDIDRMEVLKGPQGTLFGASSMGGNVRFITKKPSLNHSSGSVQVQGGGTKGAGFDGQGNMQANVVLVPGKLALDLAAGYRHDSGFVTRTFPDAAGRLVSVGNQGANDVVAGSASLRAKLTDRLEVTASVIGQSDLLHGFPAAYVPLPGYRPLSYVSNRDADVQEYSRDTWGLGSLVLNYAGQGFSAVSSTSLFARRIRQLEDDTEGSNLWLVQNYGSDFGHPAVTAYSVLKERRFTHEDRISFDEGAVLPHLSGIAGVYYQHLFSNSAVPVNHVPGLAAAGFAPDWFGANSVNNRSDDFALFGEVYYEPIPKLTITLGLRKYWNKISIDASKDTGILFAPDGSDNPALDHKQNGWVPKAVVSYKVGDQGNLYVSASKGFRPGGSTTPLPDICNADLATLGLDNNKIREYQSDSLWNYEIGAKSRLAGGRISASAAAFQIDWSNIQQSTILPSCLLPITTNAGKARIRGGELEISGRPFASVPLSIQAGLGYTKGVLLQPGVLPVPANSPLPQVPEWSGTLSGYYESKISETLSFFAAADYSFSGSTKVSNGAGGFYTRQPISMVNGNMGLSFGRSQVMIFVKNLLDKRLNYGDQPASSFDRQELLADGTYQRLPRAVVSRPRQIGIQYQLDF